MASEQTAQIGLIGVGLLGSAMAERLIRSGHPICGFDLDSNRRLWLREQGAYAAESAAEVFARTNQVILSLPTSEHVSALLDSVLDDSPAPTLILDTTTGSPEDAKHIGIRLADREIEYLDATILGSSNDLRIGDALLMAGGTETGFERAAPLIRQLVKKSFHVGPWGAGSRMKLVVNLVLGLNRAVLAEGLSFAERLGFNPELALEILSSGVAASHVMQTKGPRMIHADFEPQARLRQHHKDVRLILEQARSAGLDLPLSTLHESLLARCIAAGWGDLDNSAVIQLWKQPKSE